MEKRPKKMSLQCHGVSTSITVGLPMIWWCFWNEPGRRLGNYWGRLEKILNSAAWRSQWRHSPSHHDHNIVHHSGYCESSDWLSSRGSLAGCGCCCARGRDRSGSGMTIWRRTRSWSMSRCITRSGGCSCGCCRVGCRCCGIPLTANPSRVVTMTVVDSCCVGRAACAPVAHKSGRPVSVFIVMWFIHEPKCA